MIAARYHYWRVFFRSSGRRQAFSYGFTLMEVAIVLTIIGLLIGMALVGRDLIRMAEMRTVGNDYDRYLTAMDAFQMKYSGLPGDLKSATNFWPAQDPDPAICAATASTTTATCNGNGDGLVCPAFGTFCYEMNRFWQHLANAGYIAGTYTGVALYAPYDSAGGSHPGINAPVTRIKLATFQVRNIESAPAGNSDLYPGAYGQAFFFGLSPNPGGDDPIFAAITALDAYAIDSKFDDGKPGQGRIRSFIANSPSSYLDSVSHCASDPNPNTAHYSTTLTGPQCALIMSW